MIVLNNIKNKLKNEEEIMKKQTARRMLALTMAGAMALSMTACAGC